MDYLAYHFTVKPVQPGSEILMALVADMGFESFEQNESGFIAYVRKDSAHQVSLNGLTFTDFTFLYEVKEIAATNWNDEWEKNFSPVLVDDLLCIRAPFHPPAEHVKHEIVIMPKMSFGTGHHQTTRLVCRLMFELDLANRRVLDMGCGTGILAILAKKLGAGKVLGIDIDAWCVENATENCQTNDCADITVLQGDTGSLPADSIFDLVVANINRNILREQLPAYSQHLAPQGILIMSGFFTTDTAELSEAAGKLGLERGQSVAEDEWAALLFTKKQRKIL